MTDQEFDQLFDNGESILETLDISTAHRINCPTDLMTNQHPITPPPELVHQWVDMLSSRSDQAVFTMAAQWGADQELEACSPPQTSKPKGTSYGTTTNSRRST
jgi:hypothetical protein